MNKQYRQGLELHYFSYENKNQKLDDLKNSLHDIVIKYLSCHSTDQKYKRKLLKSNINIRSECGKLNSRYTLLQMMKSDRVVSMLKEDDYGVLIIISDQNRWKDIRFNKHYNLLKS